MVREDRVDGRIYTLEEVFEQEMERIFDHWWLYLGHGSEIPHAGDYRLTTMGRQPVILTRDEDGAVQVLMNRCRHRGNSVCQYERGNSSFFRCWYHGWTYNNKGELVGVPHPKAYGDEFQRSDFGLTKVPSVAEYRGFIFGSLDPGVPPLLEHLGKAREAIDIFVDQSPVGEIEVRAGTNKSTIHGNWKLIGMDGYHVEFVHRSIIELEKRKEAAGNAGPSDAMGAKGLTATNFTRDLGNGHVRLDYAGKLADPEAQLAPLRATAWGREYLELMEANHGVERATELLCLKSPHVGIWPNLQLIDCHIRVIEPVSADETRVTMSPATLKGVPDEVNVHRLRKHEWFYGPASFGSPDDYEIFERNQLGMQAHVDDDVLLARGSGKETLSDDGTVTGNYADEVTQRGQLRQWKHVMASVPATQQQEPV
jgi:phenylpropionate dioxygenase-like ring-hydroxylating dioxygenase large terminal subunit